MAFPSLTNSDLVLASPLLIADYVAKANSGSTTTAVSTALKGLDEDEVVGAYICFLNDGLSGVDRIIRDYTSTNHGTFTFDEVSVAVDETITFAIVFLDYTGAVVRAEQIITNDLKRKGYDVDLFLNSQDLRELLLNKTMSHICKAKRQDANDEDMYHINYLEFEDLYQKELASLTANYDLNENGTIDDDEESINLGQVSFVR